MKGANSIRLTVFVILVTTAGCIGIPQRVREKDRPGTFKAIGADIAAAHMFPVLIVPAVVDLPFSLGADIVCLPFDIVNNRRQEKDRDFWLDYFQSGVALASIDQGRSHLSFMGRETVQQRILQSALAKSQLTDLMSIGFAKEVADTQPLDAELITTHIGITNLLRGYLSGQVARNQGTPVEILGLMVSNNVALPQLVGNTNLTLPMIERIAETARSNITITAANIGPSRFCGPITHEELLVRAQAALARHPETSPQTLQMLYDTRTSDHFVMLALAKNPRTPVSVLTRIARDGPNPYIKRLAAQNLAERDGGSKKRE